MILLPFPVEGKLRIQIGREGLCKGHEIFSSDGGTQIFQQPVLDVPDRQQLQQFHRLHRCDVHPSSLRVGSRLTALDGVLTSRTSSACGEE